MVVYQFSSSLSVALSLFIVVSVILFLLSCTAFRSQVGKRLNCRQGRRGSEQVMGRLPYISSVGRGAVQILYFRHAKGE